MPQGSIGSIKTPVAIRLVVGTVTLGKVVMRVE